MRIIYVVLFFSHALFASIDVVIPCVEKDVRTLDLCIEGIKKYGKDIGRVIVVSDKKLTDKAEWFDEKKYPFQKKDIAYAMHGSEGVTQYHVGWIYQQLLKLYAPFAIPGISSDVLLLDSDTIFLRPVTFIEEDGVVNYNVGTEYNVEYFEHFQKLFPGLKKVYPQFSGICHHMLIQREIVREIFGKIEAIHRKPFWEAVTMCLDPEKQMFSEYELYFNYVFSSGYPVAIRGLRWANVSKINRIRKYQRRKFHYVSVHKWFEELL